MFVVEAVAVRGGSVVPGCCIDHHVVSLSPCGLLADQGPMIFSNVPKLYSTHDYPFVGLLWSHPELVMTSIKIFPVHSAIEI
jgi:hypothetical protein